MAGANSWAHRTNGAAELLLCRLGMVYGALGQHERARAMLQVLRPIYCAAVVRLLMTAAVSLPLPALPDVPVWRGLPTVSMCFQQLGANCGR